jgi:hypothetical protein
MAIKIAIIPRKAIMATTVAVSAGTSTKLNIKQDVVFDILNSQKLKFTQHPSVLTN